MTFDLSGTGGSPRKTGRSPGDLRTPSTSSLPQRTLEPITADFLAQRPSESFRGPPPSSSSNYALPLGSKGYLRTRISAFISSAPHDIRVSKPRTEKSTRIDVRNRRATIEIAAGKQLAFADFLQDLFAPLEFL
ncbi:hypothetical protein L596_008425 [Steinernema carpocapsae]|uniref:Uncharacterized protein n=1 Tax=Steinernema carpocapsae TaxID=34508 RepID=A0A4U5PCZ3_STECR|nr:hypothetical protein L596_008425 [Steinernema carpocapsae]